MIHLDLFSGIGGFALAVDAVWENVEHIFCEIDPFCQALLKKRFKESIIYGDIKQITANTYWNGLQKPRDKQQTNRNRQFSKIASDTESRQSWKPTKQEGWKNFSGRNQQIDILTGGFPCQPFSQAGKRRGTEDNRYLWPEMLRVIREVHPTWIIGENVAGIVNMALEQVCSDLEGEGYEVQPFIIPACAVNAPHRRDRVWIVAHYEPQGLQGQEGRSEERIWGRHQRCNSHAQNSIGERSDRRVESGRQILESKSSEAENARSGWETNWLEVATELCGVDDGFPTKLDELKLSKSRHRIERLKALGNAIVPQVAIEILKAIKKYDLYSRGSKPNAS